MIFNTQLLALATVASTLVGALPLDNIAPRAKSYSVVNVGGGASTEAVVDQTTKTVEVTNAGPTVTAKATTTVIESVPAPAETSISTSTNSPVSSPTPFPTSTSSSTSIKATTTSPSKIVTPTPIFVTVTVTDDAGPTEYYDNGMWHTSYRIKTFEAVAATTLPSTTSDMAASSTALPAW
ncbi:hypothetical protein E8E12_004858 [Didymella heteroderae]|uniref:Uncharacterized protein n=1 Tax=Didymella heteroderae TaxID=1769908 RepID=A0A9P4WLW6_9PLEO|nr:hypothetical protein E8E12_004858 [Didymella heteroderae]